MMKKLLLPFFFCLSVCALAQTSGTRPFCIGNIETVHSRILAEDRTLNVYVPPTYDAHKQYSVIYLLDGTANEDFLHITGLVQFFNLMFAMPDCLIVGIANVDRKRDFTFPTTVAKDRQAFPTTGHSAAFIDFVEQELQPFVQAHYSVSDTRYLIGQSLGGLVASEILLRKPRLFTHYLIVSPSLWWNQESLLREAPALLQQHRQVKTWVYVSVGREGKVMENDAAQLFKLLKQEPNITAQFMPMRNENHATILHSSIYEALKILFPYKE